jgi:hypothetical protein
MTFLKSLDTRQLYVLTNVKLFSIIIIHLTKVKVWLKVFF